MMRKGVIILLAGMILICTACGSRKPEKNRETEGKSVAENSMQTEIKSSMDDAGEPEKTTITEEDKTVTETTLKMKIGDHPVEVAWEDNEAAEALKAFAAESPVTINMSMYGGF